MSKKKGIFIFSTIIIAYMSSWSQAVLNLGVHPIWPKGMKTTAWNAFAEYAVIFDEKIGVGGKIDFLWNAEIEQKAFFIDTILKIQTKRTVKDLKNFMVPLSAVVFFDPIPQYIVHPVIKGQLGFNMMYYSYTEFDSLGTKLSIEKNRDPDGLYLGVLGKISVEAYYDVGKQIAVFLGYEHQIGNVTKRISSSISQDFELSGPAIRWGVSILL